MGDVPSHRPPTSSEPPRRATDPPVDPSSPIDPVSRRSAEGLHPTGDRRARVVDRIRREEERFRRLAERASDVIVTVRTDPTVRFEYVAPAIEDLTGLTPEDLYQDPTPGLTLLASPDGPGPWDPARRPGPGEVIQVAVTHRDGSEVWLESRTVVVDDPVEGRRVEGILRDITAAKLAERELMADMATLALLRDVAVEVERRTDLAAMAGGVLEVVCTRTGWPAGRVWAAPAADDPEDDDLEDPVLLARWPEGHDVDEATRRRDMTDAPPDLDEVTVAAAIVVDGRPWGAFELGSPEGVSDARLAATLASVADQFGRGVERSLADQQRRDQHDAYAAFIARAAHELRGSLAAVSTTAATLADHHEDLDHDTVVRIAGQLADGEARLRTLADRLLDLSAIETGAVHLDPVEADLGEIVRSCVEEARSNASGDQTIVLRVDGPARAVLDEIAVRQVLVNLLANATLHGGTRTDVVVEKVGGAVLVAVEDDGPGVEEHLVAQLFMPFVRGRVTRGTGTGLGLSISRGLARAMGGDLTYEPVLIAGDTEATRFVLRLPVMPV